ncbi:MAG: C40 family peptidase [Betaproteobacteria bacterium]|nr:C40 family peptidase [Betaproteobacteria bacterium]
MSAREDIVRVARSYIGTPFHHMGRLPGVGLDCAGILICSARELGLVGRFFDVPGYTPVPDGRHMLAWCEEHMTRVAKADMQPGDAIVLITDVHPQHLGILGDYRHGGLSIIHAANSAKPPRVIETRLMFSRAQRYVASYVLPGVI